MPSFGDHRVDIVVQLFPGGQDRRFVFGDIPAEGLEELVGPACEVLPVPPAWYAEQGTDDRDRVMPRDVGDDVAPAVGRARVDQSVDDLGDGGAQTFRGSRRERLAHQPAQPMVLVTVHVDDRATTRSHSGPDVMPCDARNIPCGTTNLRSRDASWTMS